jgi:hypothetical protein
MADHIPSKIETPSSSRATAGSQADAATVRPKAKREFTVSRLLIRAVAVGGLLTSALGEQSTLSRINACLWSFVLILEFGVWILERRRLRK